MTEVLIGIVSGIVSGTGMGGGTILIFLLTFMLGIEQHVAQATNLIFFIPHILMMSQNIIIYIFWGQYYQNMCFLLN